MEVPLHYLDKYLLEPVLYKHFSCTQIPSLARDSFGIWFILSVGGFLMYFVFAALNYIFLYDKIQETHPRFLKNQKRKEITLSMISIPIMGVITTPVFLLELMGYSKLYDGLGDYGVASIPISIVAFLLFTDCGIYWIHRGLHHPLLYTTIHKPHHWWKIPTPFASHAFHPLDGFAQSVPYHVYVFLFPINKWVYLSMFVFVNFWTISIHDGSYALPEALSRFVNGASHHTEHHLKFVYNYGQFFTLSLIHISEPTRPY
eukprot:TRINITY_DN10017_c0_g1_i3.p1 TRINITY_DN10017_c0_g1~~TRINITY_DN10017_c0_g1_i3.p1  ORF type:complete len:259 (-),score=1.81 TRINITY_DN10017_c0_g1_i3:18-794(-)